MVFHLAGTEHWRAAKGAGSYTQSTIGRSLDEEGFIHCSFAHQVPGVAQRFYRGETDLHLLTIDAALVDVPVVEEMSPGTGERFPHLYGPLNPGAVIDATPVAVDGDGRFEPPLDTIPSWVSAARE